MDYTPQAIYWLGGELSQNKEFEWTDGSSMAYQVLFEVFLFFILTIFLTNISNLNNRAG